MTGQNIILPPDIIDLAVPHSMVQPPVDLARRALLLGAGAGMASLVLPAYAEAAIAKEVEFDRQRTLKLVRKETGESAHFAYWRNGRLDRDGYRYANYLLRDVQAGRSVQMSVELLNVMAWVQAYFRAYGHDVRIRINDGYRTKHTNRNTEGSAKHSLHMQGRAVDIAIPNVPAFYLGELLKRLRQGGVGTYPNRGRGFVHLDVGRIRSWRG